MPSSGVGASPVHQNADVAALFSAGGEMGRLMADVDWSQTAIGPAEGWPQSLRTAVGVCLESRFPMLIWWGPDFVMIYNDGYRPMLGAKHPRAIGQRGEECWPEIWDEIGPMLHGVLERGEATWSEDQLLLLDRNEYLEEAYFTFSYSPIRDESGIAGVFSAISETTERVLGERRLRVLRELTDSIAKADTGDAACALAVAALEGHPDVPFALLYLRSDDRPSAHLAGATGPEPAALNASLSDEGSGFWPLAAVAASGEPTLLEGLGLTVASGPPDGESITVEQALALPIRSWGGLPGDVLVVGVNPLRAFDKGYREFFELMSDQLGTAIAAARAREEERDRADALAALDGAKTTFFSNVSHEFRTPLTLLQGPVDDALLDRDEPLGSRQRERLELAQRNALRMRKLVDSLLGFSRITAGGAEAAYRPTDLGKATAELAAAFGPAIEAAGLAFHVDCPPLPANAYVDGEMWETIVLNLLSNALKYTFEGSIAVSVRQADERVQLTVADTGVGISHDEQPALFQRFHQAKGVKARTEEGSGLGLALVSELAGLHGGEVSVESAPGKGSSFVVSVPLGSSHLSESRVEPAATGNGQPSQVATTYLAEALRWLPSGAIDDGGPLRGAAADTPRDGARILVVDDNRDMRAYLGRLLRPHFGVEVAVDGEAALDAARERPPDLVLTDVMMPRLDGFGLLRALRADSRTERVPVVMLTARAGEESLVGGLEEGADDYLVKPFSTIELIARLRANLDMARLREEATTRADRHVERMVELADAVQRVSAARSPEAVLDQTAAEARSLTGAAASAAELLPEREADAAGATVDGQLVLPLIDRYGAGVGRLALSPAPGASFTLEDEALVRQLAAVASATLETTQLYAHERATAETLQLSILPKRPPKVPGVELATRYLPGVAGEIGGDWYDVIPLGGDRIAIAIGDVVGKGIDAAVTMATLRSALRAYASDTPGAGDVIARLHRLVYRLGEGLGTTLFYAVLDESSGDFSYAAAGHLTPLLVQPDGTAAFLRGPSTAPLGSLQDAEPAHHSMKLSPGAVLLLYTDGLVERRDRPLDEGLEALRGAAPAPSADLDRALDELLGELLPKGELRDDVAVVALRRLGDDCRFQRYVAPDHGELSGVRRELGDWLAAVGVDSGERDDLLIATSEALANAIEHAGGFSRVNLRVLLDRGEVIVSIADGGRWRSPNPAPGYGLALIRALMDSVEIERGQMGTRVEMWRRVGPR